MRLLQSICTRQFFRSIPILLAADESSIRGLCKSAQFTEPFVQKRHAHTSLISLQRSALKMTSSQESTSVIRQNYTADVEAAVNKQINIELYASYVYLSMGSYFDRDDVALHNIASWLKKQSEEERGHGMLFMKYQNTRGGRVVLQNIQKPEKDEWGTALEAFQAALALEKFNNQSLLELHATANQNNDAQMCEFLEDKFLRDQVESIEEIGKIITNLKRVGKGLGEYIFDKEFQE